MANLKSNSNAAEQSIFSGIKRIFVDDQILSNSKKQVTNKKYDKAKEEFEEVVKGIDYLKKNEGGDFPNDPQKLYSELSGIKKDAFGENADSKLAEAAIYDSVVKTNGLPSDDNKKLLEDTYKSLNLKTNVEAGLLATKDNFFNPISRMKESYAAKDNLEFMKAFGQAAARFGSVGAVGIGIANAMSSDDENKYPRY